MAFLEKLTYGFCAVSGIGTFPFVFTNPLKRPVIAYAGGGQKEETVQQALQELIKKEEYKGCSAFEGYRRSTALYACVKEMTNGSHTPHFYYYDRTKPEKFLQVTSFSMTGIGSSSKTITMNFDSRSSQVLSYPPVWARLWRNPSLTPKSDCSISKSGNSSYSLSCGTLVQHTINT